MSDYKVEMTGRSVESSSRSVEELQAVVDKARLRKSPLKGATVATA